MDNSNVFLLESFTYKDLLLKKSYHAVATSMLSQVLLLLLYIFLANTNLWDPLQWFKSTLQTFMYLNTWVFLTVFITISFIQCLMCAKDYVLMNTFSSTRFQQILRVFSFHNFALLVFHVTIGGVLVWQLLSVVDGQYQYLVIKCAKDDYCLVDGTFFLILSGLWSGFYYFLKIYIGHKHLVFPVVQQRKFLQFRNNISHILTHSFTQSFLPTFYFAVFHFFWGEHLKNRFINLFGLMENDQYLSLMFFLYVWWFTGLYFFSMNLMRFFFFLFLTEAATFPLIKTNPNVLTLQEAITLKELPIVQNLACLDLFLLSKWSMERRKLLYSLSVIGNHPHLWNSLVENLLKLFTEYNELLTKSTEDKTIKQKMAQEPTNQQEMTNYCQLTKKNINYNNLRNMSLYDDYIESVEISYSTPPFNEKMQQFKIALDKKLNNIVNFLKIISGINYLFGELPQANIQRCLSNGRLIIWASQGIANLYASALNEDQYGVAQKDLPIILTTLVTLKQNLDKLSKIQPLSRRFSKDDFNYKMKNAINNAIKRSLFNLCQSYGKYFKEFPLNKDILLYLQANILFKNFD